jgi:hypothetical protein
MSERAFIAAGVAADAAFGSFPVVAQAEEPVSPFCQLVYLTWFEASAKGCPGFLNPAGEAKLSLWIEQMGAFAATGDPQSDGGADLVRSWRERMAESHADAAGYGDGCTLNADNSDGSRSYVDMIMSEEGDGWLAHLFSHPELHDQQRPCL